MWFPNQLPRFRVEIAHPDLRRIGRFRRPDEPFAVRRKSRPLLVIRRWIQSPRFTAARRHDPQMRNPRVRFQIDIDAVENNPFAIRRRHRRADTFERHHVFECERMFLGGLRESCSGKEKDSGDQTFHGPQSPVEPRRVRYPDARDRALLSSSAKSVTLLLMKVRRAFAFALATPRLTHRCYETT